ALRNRGLSLHQKSPEWYAERDVDTVFDTRRARSIGVPNYRTADDDELGVISGWGREMANYFDVERFGDTRSVVYKPTVGQKRIEEWLVSEVSRKAGITRFCLSDDYDLVFVWLSFLDTVGHMVPVVDDEDWQRRAYDYAASVTEEIHDTLEKDDTLVVVSDHGHQNADHTHSAYLGSTDEKVTQGAKSVLDVRGGIERVTESSYSSATNENRSENKVEQSVEMD
ncbi:MAG: alkaline phosphatase family protein, partial [Halobacteria archaeon]|nr:alkaline phosphatase family protein [Halobacteria archaeon]